MKIKLTAAQVFYVITGIEIPQNLLPSNEAGGEVKVALSKLSGESIFTHQEERVRQECKQWLSKKFPALIVWDMGNDFWKQPGTIKHFFCNYANKDFPFFEVEEMPDILHLRLGMTKEMDLIFFQGNVKEKILDEIEVLKTPMQ